MIRGVLLATALATMIGGAASARTSGERRATVDTIIIHTIGGPHCSNRQLTFSGAPGDARRWKSFFDRHPLLGIHYVVDRNGVALPSTPEQRIANHTLGDNETSIGIELVHDGDGKEPFGAAQIEGLIELLNAIRSRYRIAVENIKAHSDVDDRKFSCGGQVHKTKMDPGANFPWARIRAALEGEPRLITGPTLVLRPRVRQPDNAQSRS